MPLPWLPRLLDTDRSDGSRPAHENGITLLQLRELRSFARRLCKAYQLKRTSAWSMNDGTFSTIIKWTTLDMHDICQEIILKVIPKMNSCSWVEICTEEKQVPEIYVSHTWSEPFRDFMMGIDLHVMEYDLNTRASFFICTFAINQWNVCLGERLADSPFFHALSEAQVILLMLDKEGAALERIWVVFEMKSALVLQKEITIMTPLGHAMDTRRVGYSQVAEAIHHVDFAKAQASNPADRRQIMNSVAGVDEMTGIEIKDGIKVLQEISEEDGASSGEAVCDTTTQRAEQRSQIAPPRRSHTSGFNSLRRSNTKISLESFSEDFVGTLSGSPRTPQEFDGITGENSLRPTRQSMSSMTESSTVALIGRQPRVRVSKNSRKGAQNSDYESKLAQVHAQKFTALNDFVRQHVAHTIPAAHTGCDVSDPALRGMTLTQLRIMAWEVRQFFQNRIESPSMEGWCIDHGVCDFADVMLTHVVTLFFKAIQEEKGRSTYMECVSQQEQTPEYLITFPFSLCFCDLIAAVEWHAEARRLPGNTTYWISICAMTETESNEWISCHGSSPIFCAIKFCQGLLVVMDEKATILERALPGLEIHEVLTCQKPIDLACLSGVLAAVCPFADGTWECGNFESCIADQMLRYDVRNIVGRKVGGCDHAELTKCKIVGQIYRDGLQAPIDCDAYDEFNQRLRRKGFGPVLRALAGQPYRNETSMLAMRIEDMQDAVANIPLTHSSMSGQLGETALHIATAVGNLDSIRALLEEKSSPDATDVDGETPLHYAALCGQPDAARLLLAAGASPHSESHFMQCAADVAKENPCAFLGVDSASVGNILHRSLRAARDSRRNQTSQSTTASSKSFPKYSFLSLSSARSWSHYSHSSPTAHGGGHHFLSQIGMRPHRAFGGWLFDRWRACCCLRRGSSRHGRNMDVEPSKGDADETPEGDGHHRETLDAPSAAPAGEDEVLPTRSTIRFDAAELPCSSLTCSIVAI